MKRQFVLLLMGVCSLGYSYAQASADQINNVSFETSGNSRISYSGFAVEYVIPDYKAAINSASFTSNGIALNYEAYSPLSAKTALSANFSAVLLSEMENLEFNVGFYYLAFKGFYLKPQIGVGTYNFHDEYLKEYIGEWNFTYRAQAGYLFQVAKKEGKRDKFIDLGLAYHNIGNADLKVKYWGLALKFLWGPKPVSSNYSN